MNGSETSTSVIIPVRNGARFIEQAVSSALQQLSNGDEVLVVDDGSSDSTKSLVNRIKDQRIRVLSGSGRGVSSARNIGLAAAHGEFVAFLDHDDMWPPNRHKELLKVLRAESSIDCAMGRIRLRMENDAIFIPQLADMDGKLVLNLSLCTGLFRRGILERVGHFDENIHYCEDTDYFFRLAEHQYRAVLVDVDALIYRRHATNATCDTAATTDGLLQLIRRRRRRLHSRG